MMFVELGNMGYSPLFNAQRSSFSIPSDGVQVGKSPINLTKIGMIMIPTNNGRLFERTAPRGELDFISH